MDQASASSAAFCAHNPAAPRTLPSWQPFEDQAQTVGPPPARSSPRSEPHSEPVHIVPRPSSSAPCQSDAKGYLLPDFYSGCAPRISGRLTEGLLLWRSHLTGRGGALLSCNVDVRRRLRLRDGNQPAQRRSPGPDHFLCFVTLGLPGKRGADTDQSRNGKASKVAEYSPANRRPVARELIVLEAGGARRHVH